MRRLVALLVWVMAPGTQADTELVQLARHYDQEYGIPPYLTYAMAHQEAGRTVDGMFAPWRWTLNVDGKGLYFDTREQAEQKLVTAIENGSMVDVGVMQVNWYWNGERFESPAAALDPDTNLKVGSEILAEWYDATGSWVEAIARYHTGPITSDEELLRARDYATRVMNHHERILEKFRY